MAKSKGFTKEGWERIQDFNKNAKDPNRPDVKFTFENRELASRAGKLGHVSPLSVAKMSLTKNIQSISLAIAEGRVPKDSNIEKILMRIRSGVAISGTVQAMLDNMLESIDELEDPRDRFAAKEKIVKIYMDVLKLHHHTEETVRKKLPLEQLQEIMRQKHSGNDE